MIILLATYFICYYYSVFAICFQNYIFSIKFEATICLFQSLYISLQQGNSATIRACGNPPIKQYIIIIHLGVC